MRNLNQAVLFIQSPFHVFFDLIQRAEDGAEMGELELELTRAWWSAYRGMIFLEIPLEVPEEVMHSAFVVRCRQLRDWLLRGKETLSEVSIQVQILAPRQIGTGTLLSWEEMKGKTEALLEGEAAGMLQSITSISHVGGRSEDPVKEDREGWRMFFNIPEVFAVGKLYNEEGDKIRSAEARRRIHDNLIYRGTRNGTVPIFEDFEDRERWQHGVLTFWKASTAVRWAFRPSISKELRLGMAGGNVLVYEDVDSFRKHDLVTSLSPGRVYNETIKGQFKRVYDSSQPHQNQGTLI